jgi:lactate permease
LPRREAELGRDLQMNLRTAVCRGLVTIAMCVVVVGASAFDLRADGDSFRFAVTADSRDTSSDSPVDVRVLRQLMDDMNSFKPLFCLFPGDLVFGGDVNSDGLKRELQEWLAATRDFRAILYVAPGNHDFRHWIGRAEAWRQTFPGMPSNGPGGEEEKCSYYVDYSTSRFISILSDWQDGHVGVDQKWLDEVLDASSGFEHLFVMSHHPMQQLGGVKGAFWQSLVRHHVDVYFASHWHLYNRSQPGGGDTWQVVVGTAGAPLVPWLPPGILGGTTITGKYGFVIVDVNGPSVKVSFYSNAAGKGHFTEAMDSFVISPRSATRGEIGEEGKPKPLPGSTPKKFEANEGRRPLYTQTYRPVGNLAISALIAGIPLYILLFMLAVKRASGHKAAIPAAVAALALAIFCWRMPAGLAVSAALYGAAFGLFPVVWILLAAVWFHKLTVESGGFEIIKNCLNSITEDRRLQAILIAFAFGSFLEGAVGFGAPVAVTAAVLAGLGFDPLYAAAICLIANSVPVAFGRMGMPIVAAARLTDLDPLLISKLAGRQLSLLSLIIPLWLSVVMGGFRRSLEVLPAVLVAGLCFALTLFFSSSLLGSVRPAILSSLATMIGLVLFLKVWQPRQVWRLPGEGLRTGGRAVRDYTAGQVLRAWVPYLVLAAMVLLWEVWYVKAVFSSIGVRFPWPWLHRLVIRTVPFVTKDVPYAAQFNFNLGASAGTAIFLSGLLSLLFTPHYGLRRAFACLARTVRELRLSVLTISLLGALASIMNYAGMTGTLGVAFAATGALIPFFSPILGWLGVFLTGSDLRSDAFFAPLQRGAAQRIGVAPELVVAATGSGGACGKMISPQSIAVAAGATNLPGRDGYIFRFILGHSVGMVVFLSLLTSAQAYLFPWMSP